VAKQGPNQIFMIAKPVHLLHHTLPGHRVQGKKYVQVITMRLCTGNGGVINVGMSGFASWSHKHRNFFIERQ
jgi:hypothetical protein